MWRVRMQPDKQFLLWLFTMPLSLDQGGSCWHEIGLSANGWINTDLFEAWFIEHFIPNAVSSHPLFLHLDGHSTAAGPQIRHGTPMYYPLSPITHHSRNSAVGLGIFAPLKVQWGRVCHNFYPKNPGRIVNKFNLNSLFSEAWYGAVTSVNIMAGFCKAGVFPFNPDAVTLSTCPDNSAVPHSPEARKVSLKISSHSTGLEAVSTSGSSESVQDISR